ncbi:MAG TPA: Asp-tRNA(Asn)/Glu-tRNA(Gln) amidotransferase subunit GatC [Vicinamibacterales bacterium]|nr:Asp-tRNA(Asn)/Glu-tRNA(Gln) amidotransferase subunit GatC [Vicinamibacterales bacterium]
MADPITARDVAHIARLARLDLAADEAEAFARQLTDILAYAAIVQQVNTPDLPSASSQDGSADGRSSEAGSAEGRASQRADAATPGISRDAALASAPDRSADGTLFRVPKVL